MLLAGEVEFIEATTNFGRELIEPANDESKLAFGLGDLDGRLVPLAESDEAGFEACDPRFELRAVDQPLGIVVHQPTNATRQAGHLTVELNGFVGLGDFVSLRKATMIFFRHPAQGLK